MFVKILIGVAVGSIATACQNAGSDSESVNFDHGVRVVSIGGGQIVGLVGASGGISGDPVHAHLLFPLSRDEISAFGAEIHCADGSYRLTSQSRVSRSGSTTFIGALNHRPVNTGALMPVVQAICSANSQDSAPIVSFSDFLRRANELPTVGAPNIIERDR